MVYKTLQGGYRQYVQENGYTEKDSVVKWYRGKSADGTEWTETTTDSGKTVTINSGRDMVLNGDQNVTQYVHLTFIRPNILMNGD